MCQMMYNYHMTTFQEHLKQELKNPAVWFWYHWYCLLDDVEMLFVRLRG